MPKQTKQNQFAEEFRSEAVKNGGLRTLGDAVGLPDKEDWNNIVRIINLYRKESIKKYGKDILVESIADARKEHGLAGNRYSQYSEKYQLVNKDSNMRHVFELPESFIHAIEKAYPLMFQEKTHFAWFAKNFKELRISEKY